MTSIVTALAIALVIAIVSIIAFALMMFWDLRDKGHYDAED